jgi:hypothetical protein
MAEDTNKPGAFNKELLVILPIIGSAIAITYDVGYFTALDINFFTVFSVSEHIAFALEILPLAILVTVLFVLIPIVVDKGRQDGTAEARRELSTGRKQKFYTRKMFWFEIGFIIWIVYWAYYTGFVSASLVVLFSLASTMLIKWFAIYLLRPIVWIGLSSFVCLTMSFAIGMDVATSYRHSPNYKYTVKTADAELKAKVIRSGERGLLFHDEVSKQLLLLPWSEIKRVSSSSTGATIKFSL